MENELCKKKTTAPDTSVGADDGQPLHNSIFVTCHLIAYFLNKMASNMARAADGVITS